MNTPHCPRRVLCLVLVCVWSIAVPAQEPLGTEVEGLLALARQSNPDYQSKRYEAEAAAHRVVPAGALADPKFRVELRDINRSQVGDVRYRLMQDLPWYGKRDLKQEIAELEAQGATQRSSETWNEVAAKIKTNYAQLYYLDQNARLARELLDLMVRLEQITQVRYANGVAAQQDVIRAQVEQTTMRNDLITLESEQRQFRARMNALVNRPVSAVLVPAQKLRPLPAPDTLDAVVLEARARARNPSLSAEESLVKAADKGRDLAYKNRYPDFTVGAALIQAKSEVQYGEVMLELNIPLQLGTRRAQEGEATAKWYAARTRRDATANQVLADLDESLAALDAVRHIEALVAERLLPETELAFKSALAGYETGKVDFATLLDAQRQIRQAKQSYIKAQADGQMRLAEIERMVGEDL